MITGSDIGAAVSTIFEAWFVESFNDTVVATEQQVGSLVQVIDVADHEGDRVQVDWLGAVPGLREWIDEKRAQQLNRYNWTVRVKDWESTVRIRLNTLRDAKFAIYEPRIRAMAVNAARHWYDLMSDLIRLGASTVCYDGQYFFDTDHLEGASGAQSNKLTGTGTSVSQVRTDYFAAKAALMQFKDDRGYPCWTGDFRPLIWAPASGPVMDALETLRSEETLPIGGGAQSNNVIRGKFDVIYDPRLTDLNDWAMFNPSTPLKPFVALRREAIHYVDNFGTGNPDVWNSRIGEAGVEGRDNMDYAMWQSAVLTTNA